MRMRPITTIKEWVEMLSTATLWEAIGCIMGIVSTALTYILLIIFWAVLLLGIFAIII